MRTRAFQFALLLAILLTPFTSLSGGPPAHAEICDVSWKDPVSGNWTEASKWSTNAVPTNAQNVCIIVDGTYTVTLTGSQAANSVMLGAAGNSGTPTLWIRSGSWLESRLNAANGFTNAGTIRMESVGAYPYSAILTVNAGTLLNTGTININYGNYGGGREIQAQVDNRGAINVGIDTAITKASAQHTNSGTINVSGGSLYVNQSGTNPSFTNIGIISVASSPTVRSLHVNNGTFRNTSPGTITGGGTVNLNNVTFFGTGSIAANVNNNGSQVNPGASPGILNITGNYVQNSYGTLNVELAGAAPGTGYDQVNVSGNANLAGTLNVAVAPTYCVEGGYTIMTYGSRIGDFATKIGLSPGGGRVLVPNVGPTTYVLSVSGPTCNQPPLASGDTYNVNEDTLLTVAAPGGAWQRYRPQRQRDYGRARERSFQRHPDAE
ncbi:MAG: hypothetical protein HY675_11965 [Chloroflexi bacterium]|nr:hypothetical protein [Chloroflexota bacterium]